VRPTDLASVRAIMRACACLWGGTYNPIIPVFKKAPKEWKPEIYERFKGSESRKGMSGSSNLMCMSKPNQTCSNKRTLPPTKPTLN
jgi:hypothetical protein